MTVVSKSKQSNIKKLKSIHKENYVIRSSHKLSSEKRSSNSEEPEPWRPEQENYCVVNLTKNNVNPELIDFKKKIVDYITNILDL